jgi:hypothetical protein
VQTSIQCMCSTLVFSREGGKFAHSRHACASPFRGMPAYAYVRIGRSSDPADPGVAQLRGLSHGSSRLLVLTMTG